MAHVLLGVLELADHRSRVLSQSRWLETAEQLHRRPAHARIGVLDLGDQRGRMLSAYQYFWSLGSIFATVGAWAFIPNMSDDLGWRVYTCVCSVPLWVALAAVPCLHATWAGAGWLTRRSARARGGTRC